jgi:hypothetical protein
MITALSARRQLPWLRLLLALTAVPALLTGLLAMHVLSGSAGEADVAGHHAVAFAQAADVHTDAAGTDHHDPSTAGVCGPDCEREHQMSAAACILAILVAAFALAIRTGWFRMGWLFRPVRSLSLLTRTPAEPTPPSLVVLSISRT